MICVARRLLAIFVLVLSPALGAQSFHLFGKVTVKSRPAVRVWVLVYDGTQEKARTLTGDDGQYYIGHLNKQKYTVVVRKKLTSKNMGQQDVTVPTDHDVNFMF